MDEILLDRLRRSLGLVLKDISESQVEKLSEGIYRIWFGSILPNTDDCFTDVPWYAVKIRHYDENDLSAFVYDVVLSEESYEICGTRKGKEIRKTWSSYEFVSRYYEKHPLATCLYHDLERMPVSRISPVKEDCDYVEISYRSLWLVPDTDLYFHVPEKDVHFIHRMDKASDGSLFDSGRFADCADIDLHLASYRVRWKNEDTFWRNRYVLLPKKYLVDDYLDRSRCDYSGKSDQEFLSGYHFHDAEAWMASCFIQDALV